jgi:NAD(P)-dependent dehydrogenase (short-subunit alcohol dehydrogenase family)
MSIHDDRNRAMLVTGGSRGLGRAFAELAAEQGHEVVLVARGHAALDDAVRGIRSRGGRAHGIVADVGDRESSGRIAAEAAALVGNIDVLVHAASVLGPVPLAPLADTRDSAMEEALAVNFLGAFRLTRAVVGAMAMRGHGVVVHVSSDAGIAAYPTWGAYGASKAALDHLGRTWAEELRETGVRVFSFDPGEMDTEMHATAMPDADRSVLAHPRDVARTLLQAVSDGRLAPTGGRVLASVLAQPAPPSPDSMEVSS